MPGPKGLIRNPRPSDETAEWLSAVHPVPAERELRAFFARRRDELRRRQREPADHAERRLSRLVTAALETSSAISVIGAYAQQTPTQTLLVRQNDGIPNDVARLKGARMMTAAEAECNRKLAEALVKQLTGGDPISARFLHGEWFTFNPTFKLFRACCLVDPDGRAPAGPLFNAYRRWCASVGTPALGIQRFTRAMKAAGVERHCTRAGRFWVGLRLVAAFPAGQAAAEPSPPPAENKIRTPPPPLDKSLKCNDLAATAARWTPCVHVHATRLLPEQGRACPEPMPRRLPRAGNDHDD